MVPDYPGPAWHINWLGPRLPWNKQAIRPAEIGDGLCRVMISQENNLEDANYNKVVPNQYVVEISPENYNHHYEPLGTGLINQWRDRLVEHLMTANNRLGRKEYRLGGQLQIEIRPATDIKEYQARIFCRVLPDQKPTDEPDRLTTMAHKQEVAFLELVDASRRWPLYPGDNIIGRDESCDVYLDIPMIQEKPLISAQHAMIRIKAEQSLLLDGDPSGKSSTNGTYVNSQRIPAHGWSLQDGDIVILAALDPQHPLLDTPGVAALRFRKAV